MNVTRKDATIVNTGGDEDHPGSFEVILSAPTLDRDGDTLNPEDWKQPLPDHITFDQDHAMTVAGTVGSGTPRIDPDGSLRVSGTYSSLPRAQEVRTLVKEGHIRTTSVAFMSEKSTKDGKSRVTRELLNGAFVAIPSNREAVILASKGVKAGARNSATDMHNIQVAHDALMALGAHCSPEDSSGAAVGTTGGKSVDVKDMSATDEPSPGELAQAVDAALDQVDALLDGIDITTLPEPVQQALGLITAAEEAVDELLDALGVPDPDEGPATETAAPSGDAAKSVDAETLEMQNRLTVITAAASLAG